MRSIRPLPTSSCTHRHRVPEQRELFLREIADNRRALAECGLNPERLTHFCYPSGLYQSAFLPWLAEAGVVSAVTCVRGLASKRQHRLLLPRFIDTGRHRTWSSRVGLLDCQIPSECGPVSALLPVVQRRVMSDAFQGPRGTREVSFRRPCAKNSPARVHRPWQPGPVGTPRSVTLTETR